MPRVVNMVGSGLLEVEIDIENLYDDLDTPFSNYMPNGLYLRLQEGGPLIVIARSGKYLITGADSHDELTQTRGQLLSYLSSMGVIERPDDEGFSLKNIVGVGDMNRSIDLNKLVINLGLEKCEYEPEQFPGVVYRPVKLDIVMLIFGSGKVVLTGANDLETLHSSMDRLTNDIAGFLDVEP